ncbi:Membrane associated serine protease, rhomboid family [Salegentibacter echinorum]|uniref:Membrane associated serine protease, rhomboid family n=1 Tax=Salegentibacter echinorum TaxID=1073325 RepID=A0A1M5GMY9_SALEC|nr:rhomboid family intramembrane serine protease [Salegentibacter echinorum]SHG05099.1 Membrane associated serine protease, rhomboid family [Salegentibacter echinorum]
MEKASPFQFTTGVLGYPVLFVLLIWIVFWFEVRFGVSFNDFGVRPREIKGLRGILFSPFIHGDLKHLFNNTIPLFVLSMALFYFYKRISWQVLLFGLLLTGILTWAIGRPANHIGASGIIYMLAAFLFFKGIFSKHYRLVALSLIVVFLYGGMLWYVTPINPEISWEGHLSGLISGFTLSLIYRTKIAKSPKYEWEKPEYNEEEDLFMQHFDENGNFVEQRPEPPEPIDDSTFQEDREGEAGVTYRYHYRKSEEKE